MFTFVKVNQKENSNHMLHLLYSGEIFVFLQMINATNKCYNYTTDIMLGQQTMFMISMINMCLKLKHVRLQSDVFWCNNPTTKAVLIIKHHFLLQTANISDVGYLLNNAAILWDIPIYAIIWFTKQFQ